MTEKVAILCNDIAIQYYCTYPCVKETWCFYFVNIKYKANSERITYQYHNIKISIEYWKML